MRAARTSHRSCFINRLSWVIHRERHGITAVTLSAAVLLYTSNLTARLCAQKDRHPCHEQRGQKYDQFPCQTSICCVACQCHCSGEMHACNDRVAQTVSGILEIHSLDLIRRLKRRPSFGVMLQSGFEYMSINVHANVTINTYSLSSLSRCICENSRL